MNEFTLQPFRNRSNFLLKDHHGGRAGGGGGVLIETFSLTSTANGESQTLYYFSFVETPRKFIIAKLSIRKLGSSSVLKMHYY